MATTVRDLEFECLPNPLGGLEGYSEVFVLLRFRGRPVGEAWLPVQGGEIDGATLREALVRAAGKPLRQQWLQTFLVASEPERYAPAPIPATVAVCTRDRPQDLHRCLVSLLALPDEGQEVIVVDSGSATGETRHVVAQFPFVRYLREERPGLNRARNRALREARHELVAFVDDDAVVDPGWLRALTRNFKSPRVLCVTGLTMPLELESEAQRWFQLYCPFGRGFHRVVYDRSNCNPLAAGRVGAGVNMALRRSALADVGPFDEALDAGTPTCSGGDTEMFSRLLAAGYQIVYDPAALSWHRHRRCWRELRETIYGYGVGVYAVWTRRLLWEREWGVLPIAWNWFSRYQLPALLRSLLRRPGSTPPDILLAELRGCLRGPWAYLASRHQTGQLSEVGK